MSWFLICLLRSIQAQEAEALAAGYGRSREWKNLGRTYGKPWKTPRNAKVMKRSKKSQGITPLTALSSLEAGSKMFKGTTWYHSLRQNAFLDLLIQIRWRGQ